MDGFGAGVQSASRSELTVRAHPCTRQACPALLPPACLLMAHVSISTSSSATMTALRPAISAGHRGCCVSLQERVGWGGEEGSWLHAACFLERNTKQSERARPSSSPRLRTSTRAATWARHLSGRRRSGGRRPGRCRCHSAAGRHQRWQIWAATSTCLEEEREERYSGR